MMILGSASAEGLAAHGAPDGEEPGRAAEDRHRDPEAVGTQDAEQGARVGPHAERGGESGSHERGEGERHRHLGAAALRDQIGHDHGQDAGREGRARDDGREIGQRRAPTVFTAASMAGTM